MKKVTSSKLEIGKKYRIYYEKGNISNKTIHILAIVDDNQYVIKWWNKWKQVWEYSVKWEYAWELKIENNALFKA